MYGQQILGLDLKTTRELKEALFDGNEILRIGFTRVNINFFWHDEDIDYQVKAIEFIANYGWMFLPHYKFEVETGYWVNREEKEDQVRSWLGQIDYSNGYMEYKGIESTDVNNVSFIRDPSQIKKLPEYIEEAQETLVKVVENYKNLYGKSEMDQKKLIAEPYQKLIWFLFPTEVLSELLNMKYHSPLSFEFIDNYNKKNPQISHHVEIPFEPLDYTKGKYEYKFSEEYIDAKKKAE